MSEHLINRIKRLNTSVINMSTPEPEPDPETKTSNSFKDSELERIKRLNRLSDDELAQCIATEEDVPKGLSDAELEESLEIREELTKGLTDNLEDRITKLSEAQLNLLFYDPFEPRPEIFHDLVIGGQSRIETRFPGPDGTVETIVDQEEIKGISIAKYARINRRYLNYPDVFDDKGNLLVDLSSYLPPSLYETIDEYLNRVQDVERANKVLYERTFWLAESNRYLYHEPGGTWLPLSRNDLQPHLAEDGLFRWRGDSNESQSDYKKRRMEEFIIEVQRQHQVSSLTEAQHFGGALASDQEFNLLSLFDLDVANDLNCVLGEGWLSRGEGLLIVGQSGIGKSTLTMQMAVRWARGHTCFGIKAKQPLSSLIVQQENNEIQCGKMVQGVAKGLSYSREDIAGIQNRIHIHQINGPTGKEFLTLVERLIEKHAPVDLVWIDPLLAYAGCAINDNDEIGEFLYQRLSPLAKQSGVVPIVFHHTGKPIKNDGHPIPLSELQYAGLGASAQCNWAREVGVIGAIPIKGDHLTFNLSFCKRRKDAGMRTIIGNKPTASIIIEHSPDAVCWRQREEISEQELPKKAKTSGKSGAQPSPYHANLERLRNLIDVKYQGDPNTVPSEDKQHIAAEFNVDVRSVRRWIDTLKQETA
jgi:hypothetical protein